MTHRATKQEASAGGPLASVEPWDLVADVYSAGIFDQLNRSLGEGPVEESYTIHLGVGAK